MLFIYLFFFPLGVTTALLDNLAAETCAYMTLVHPDYSKLAARIAVSNLHKETSNSMLHVLEKLRNCTDKKGEAGSLIAEDVFEIMSNNMDKINERIDYNRDFNYDFFGFKTLEKSYLLKVENKIVERPQQMLMRVSFGIHKEDIESALETYDLMS